MAMTEKQIKRRMDEAWEMFYLTYDMTKENECFYSLEFIAC